MQVTTKNIKKDRHCMKFPAPKALCAKGVFQIQRPISGVNFSNNTSILHITYYNLWNLYRMVRKNFQIYSDQITRKCILWNSFSLGMIWPLIPPCRIIPPIQLPQKICPPMKCIIWKKVPTPHTLGRRRHHERVYQNKIESKRR